VPMTEENRRKNWMDAVLVPPARREYIRACLANGERLLERPRILISTIHRVKGGEADNVALLTDLSTKPWQQRGMDEEKRVLYVAVTRARERLVLVQPQTPRHYQI
jgi:superfamily I DNA/RNA helicase